MPGVIAAVSIIVVIFSALITLWLFAASTDSSIDFLFDHYLWAIFRFTIFQAGVSTLLSVILALVLAKVVYQINFPGKSLMLRLYAMTFVLPGLVVITGLVEVYGRQGWIVSILTSLGFDISLSIYGLPGILIAHVFYNLPFAFRLFHQSLDNIPVEQKQLAAQIGLSYWQRFRYMEWPLLLRQMLPTAALIFMFCFSSFVIVLTLGGGPKNTTLEVAIYQAIRDFELDKAVILSILQLLFCFGFMLLLRKLTPNFVPAADFSKKQFMLPISAMQWVISIVIITLSLLFILSPILAVIINGLQHFSLRLINQPLLTATLTSIGVATGAGCLTVCLATLLLWTNSRLKVHNLEAWSHRLILSGSLILAVPSMVLAAGFFLLFFIFSDLPFIVPLLVIMSNGLMALPFVLKILENPMTDIAKKYDLLSQSLNLSGLNHFRLIEFKALKTLFFFAFAFACVISLGDFGIIALFGSEDFVTLPFYLYQQIAAYRNQDGAFTALLLLLLSFGLFSLIEYLAKYHDRT